MFLLEKFSSVPLDGCNCPDSCNVSKYGAYLSYGKYPSWESNKLYANNSETIMEKFRSVIIFFSIYIAIHSHIINPFQKLIT